MSYDDLEFSNASSRCPLVLVLDVSSSMATDRGSGNPLDSLNEGLEVLVNELYADPLARKRVEVSIVAYGSEVSPATDFVGVENIVLPTLVPSGMTSTGSAIVEALNALESRKKVYKEQGVTYYRPFVILMTDGVATDDVTEAKQRIAEGEKNGKFSFYAVGVEGYDHASLSALVAGSGREPLPLKGVKFGELFAWLSASVASISASQPGDKVAMPSPAGWAEF